MILSDVTAASAQQLALIAAVNFGGKLLQIQRTLHQIQQATQQQGQQLAQIRQEMSRSKRNNFARLLNSSINRSDTCLEVLYGLNNEPVQGFPEAGANIRVLSVSSSTPPVDGDLADRKQRLIKYIGLLSNLI